MTERDLLPVVVGSELHHRRQWNPTGATLPLTPSPEAGAEERITAWAHSLLAQNNMFPNTNYHMQVWALTPRSNLK